MKRLSSIINRGAESAAGVQEILPLRNKATSAANPASATPTSAIA